MERGMHNLLSMQDFRLCINYATHKLCMHKFCKKSADFGLKRNPLIALITRHNPRTAALALRILQGVSGLPAGGLGPLYVTPLCDLSM